MKRTLRLLLIEDSEDDAQLLLANLRQGGFEPIWRRVETAAELAAALCEEWEVVVSDYLLPGFDGISALRCVQSTGRDLPFLLVSGAVGEELAVTAMKDGAHDFLLKDRLSRLAPAVERELREAGVRRQRAQATAALQRERDQLEARVLECTAELSELNHALQEQIAHRRAAEEARQKLLRQLAQAEESERSRIARELHDQLGQELTALKLGLHLLQVRRSRSAEEQQALQDLQAVADHLMRTTQRLAWELRPTVLDNLGLQLALQRLAGEWSAKSGVPVAFHSDDLSPRRLSLEIESTLYRLAQEALTNIARHAQAKSVQLRLERRGEEIFLQVRDDGRGFDPAATLHTADERSRLGLLGMQERVSLAGGSMLIQSSNGGGTAITARLPLEVPTPTTENWQS